MRKKIYNFLRLIDNSKPGLIIFSEMVLGAMLSVFSVLIFTKIIKDLFENDFHQFDLTVSNFIYSFREPFLTKIMLFISFLGSGYFLIFSALLILLFLTLKKRRHETMLFIFTFFIGFFINIFLKNLIARPRPLIDPLISEATYSFPSGHSMNSFVFYALIAFYVFRFTRKKRLALLISSLSILLIFLIGLSRIYLGVHYPSDVIAGYVGGFWWFVTALVIEKTITLRKILKSQ